MSLCENLNLLQKYFLMKIIWEWSWVEWGDCEGEWKSKQQSKFDCFSHFAFVMLAKFQFKWRKKSSSLETLLCHRMTRMKYNWDIFREIKNKVNNTRFFRYCNSVIKFSSIVDLNCTGALRTSLSSLFQRFHIPFYSFSETFFFYKKLILKSCSMLLCSMQ